MTGRTGDHSPGSLLRQPLANSLSPRSLEGYHMVGLDQLQVGQVGRIVAIEGDDTLAQRLMEMGLLEGEDVEILGFAPMGDPVELRLTGYRLSLRRSEAARVQVELVAPPGASA